MAGASAAFVAEHVEQCGAGRGFVKDGDLGGVGLHLRGLGGG